MGRNNQRSAARPARNASTPAPAPAPTPEAEWDGSGEVQGSSVEAQAVNAEVTDGAAESGVAPQPSSPPAPTASAPTPAAAPVAAQPEPAAEPEFPEGLNESFALLRKAEAEPVKSKEDAKRKAAYLQKLKGHIFAMQQGLKAVRMGANELAKEPGLKVSGDDGIKAKRMELRARDDRDLAEVLEENRRLKERGTAGGARKEVSNKSVSK
jgi:hypothetical protein